MAFVRKSVLENKELYDSFNLKYRGKKIEVDDFSKWYVDEERNIYFEFLGGGALEHPSTYALILNKRKVIIDVEVRPSTDKVRWIIDNIKASKELEHHKNDIINIIKEVVTVIYKERKVEFLTIPSVIFVEEEQLNG